MLVVSDVLLYREGVAQGLARLGGFAEVAGSDLRGAAAALEQVSPDAILLDAGAAATLDLVTRLRTPGSGVPIVGFGIADERAALACIEAGLIGIVGRDASLAELATTIDGALAGEVRCSPQLVARLCERVATLSRARSPANDAPLTRREGQVAELIAQGLSNKEIALALGIGPATVKNHVHNILEKLNVARRGAIGVRLPAVRRTG